MGETVWPLVATSLTWYGVLCDAVGRGADGCTRVVLFATATFSVMHWCAFHSTGWRAMADRWVARASFLYFTVLGAAKLATIGHAWALWLVMCACYARSWCATSPVQAWRRDLTHWVWTHALFHMCIGCGQLLVLAVAFP